MQILMIGAGGVGGYFGGRLVEAGRQVTFLARGAHLEALQTSGLTINSPRGDVHLPNIRAVADTADFDNDAATPDLILIAVKLGDTEAAIAAARCVAGPQTLIASLQNGIDAETLLQEAFGQERVLGGVARISATIEAPGVISHKSEAFACIELGELDGSPTSHLNEIAACLSVPHMEFEASPDIRRAIWGKFVFLATLSAATTLARTSIGQLRDTPESRAWIEELTAEAALIARAEGVDFPERAQAAALKQLDGLPHAMTASMTHDLLQGKPLELDWLSGAIVRLGQTHGIDTPAHRHTVAALAPFRGG